MNESSIQTQHLIIESDPFKMIANEPEPQRIQVSCITNTEAIFPPPRPFNIKRGKKNRVASSRFSDYQNIEDKNDDILERSVRSIRVIGYTILGIAVLLLVLDGFVRTGFGF